MASLHFWIPIFPLYKYPYLACRVYRWIMLFSYRGLTGLFLSTRMLASPILGPRLVRSQWDFHHWIPCEKSGRTDYSLGLFKMVDQEVFLDIGLCDMWTLPWHAYVAHALIWHITRHVSTSSWHMDNDLALCGYISSLCILTPRGMAHHTHFSSLYLMLYHYVDIIYH